MKKKVRRAAGRRSGRWASTGRSRPLTVVLERIVVALVAVGLVLASPGARGPVYAQSDSATVAAAMQRIDGFMRGLDEIRAAIDRTQFDVDALALELAFEEPDAIADWVRRNIAFEPYPGLLRGPQGTLMARAGNALDQAALLARLLNDAGFEARVARAMLDTPTAAALVSMTAVPKEPAPPIGDLDGIEDAVRSLGSLFGRDVSDLLALFGDESVPFGPREDPVFAEAADTASFLRDALESAGIPIGAPPVADELVAEAREYFWVEYRMGPSDAWEHAHPAFSDAAAEPRDIQASGHIEDAVPEELLHKLRFAVRIEQRLGDDVVVHDVVPAWERPVANLVGEPITYTNVADTLSQEAFENLDEALAGARLFGPVLSFELAPGGQFFDRNGSTVDPAAAASPAAGIFSTLGESLGDAAGAVAGEEDPGSYVTLAKQTLEYTLIAPGGREQVFTRDVLDVDRLEGTGDELRAAVAKDLLQSHTFMVDVGGYAPGYVLDRYLERFLALRPALEYYVAQRLQPDADVAAPSDQDVPNTPWLGFLALYTAFEAPDTLESDLVSYRPGPALAVHSEDLPGTTTLRQAIDVIANDRRTLRTNGATVRPDPEHNMLRGVWETYQESAPFAGAEAPQISTPIVFAAARDEGIPLRVVAPGNAGALAELDMEEDMVEHVRADLARGYAVVVPARPPASIERSGWWRVDAATGVTLGITDGGLGGLQQAEYLKVLTVATGTITTVVCFGAKIGGSDSAIKTFSDCGKLGVAAAAIVPAGAAYYGVALAASKGSLFALAILYFALELTGNF